MRRAIHCVLIWALSSLSIARAAGDPYARIEVVRLPNGLPVYLLPDRGMDLAHVEVRVHTGWSVEDKAIYGVAHLTEHALFRPTVGESLIYAARAHGGDVNGHTTPHYTNFFGTIGGAARATWLLERLGSAVAPRILGRSQVEKAKREVDLERGHPSPGTEPAQWESAFLAPEFGLKTGNPGVREVAESTKRLTREDVQAFFNRYYRADNMAIIVVGNFDRRAILASAREWFGDYRAAGEPIRTAPPAPEERPFVHEGETPSPEVLPMVELGAKFWSQSPEDESVMHLYVSYLSFRLERELRGADGAVYSVRPQIRRLPGGCGTATIVFGSGPEDYPTHVRTAMRLLETHSLGGLTDAEIGEALRLHEWDYRNANTGLEGLTGLARDLADFRFKHGGKATPFGAFKGLTPADVRARVARLFAPERRYAVFWTPPQPKTDEKQQPTVPSGTSAPLAQSLRE